MFFLACNRFYIEIAKFYITLWPIYDSICYWITVHRFLVWVMGVLKLAKINLKIRSNFVNINYLNFTPLKLSSLIQKKKTSSFQTITSVLKLKKGDREKLSFGQSCGIRPTGFDRAQIIFFSCINLLFWFSKTLHLCYNREAWKVFPSLYYQI